MNISLVRHRLFRVNAASALRRANQKARRKNRIVHVQQSARVMRKWQRGGTSSRLQMSPFLPVIRCGSMSNCP